MMCSAKTSFLLLLLKVAQGFVPFSQPGFAHSLQEQENDVVCRLWAATPKNNENYDDDDDDDEQDNANANDNDNDNDFSINKKAMGPEKSRMTDFVAQYLGKNKDKNIDNIMDIDNIDIDIDIDDDQDWCISGATHLVAIPMDTCHELLLELESVQRAILYHCPILVDACISPSMTRLPLLYVQAPANSMNAARVTRILAELVEPLVQQHMFQDASKAEGEGAEENKPLDMLEEMMNVNPNGIRPFTMTFQSLEIDGTNNNVLNTVGSAKDKGATTRLANFVNDLQRAIRAQGWKTALPPDPNNDKSEDESEDTNKKEFRARIPFMELPKEFHDNLNRFKAEGTEIREQDVEFLTSDQGGNGISPIFWCQWWDDVFGKKVRLREIGIYPKQQALFGGGGGGGSGGAKETSNNEDAALFASNMFYLPYETIALPEGSASMLKTEREFEKYQDDRLEEEQKRWQSEAIDINAASSSSSSGNSNSNLNKPNEEPDVLMFKTRERLEQLYVQSGEVAEMVDTDETEEEASTTTAVPAKTDDDEQDDEMSIDLSPRPTASSEEDYMEDWMAQRIRNVVNNRESVKASIPVKKDMPPIEDNPVFKAYKDGTLVPKNQRPKPPTKKDLGPYPSREHFIGIWRVVTSPTGFAAEESSDETSENLILRIDGTTAGGPVLDPETNQKAAGGTWKMFEEDGDVKLRIRLVIPPKKERVIEMLGVVNRMNMSNDIPMRSKAFGIPHLEAMAKEANKGADDDLMHCGGEVHMEDAVTKKNKERIGTFSLMKVQGPLEKGQYTITIPKPIRNQD